MNASNVESEEPGVYPMLGHTARAGLFLGRTELVCRKAQDYRDETGYKYGYKQGRSHAVSYEQFIPSEYSQGN